MKLKEEDIRPGDLLLARGENGKLDPRQWVRDKIESVTGSPYTHAAIAVSPTEIADARPGGVKIRPLRELVNESVCVGVLRLPDVWDPSRLSTLLEFMKGLETAGAKYNYAGLRRFQEKKARHQGGVTGALEQFFKNEEDGTPQSADVGAGPFFCSELVVAGLIHVGYIAPSAAVVYKPGSHAPGDLLADPTYGYLVGVLAPNPEFELPADDPLHLLTKYELFERR